MTGKSKLIACFIVMFGFFVIMLCSGIFIEEKIREQRYLQQLDSEDENQRQNAIKELGQLRSIKSITKLITIAKQSCAENRFGPSDSYMGLRGKDYVVSIDDYPKAINSLVKIGSPTIPFIIELIKDGDVDRHHKLETDAYFDIYKSVEYRCLQKVARGDDIRLLLHAVSEIAIRVRDIENF